AFNNSNFEDAIAFYKKAIELNYADHSIHNNISICYRQTGDLEKAIKHINFAIEISPKNALYYSTKATILSKSGDYVEALEAITLAISLDNNPEYLMNK